MHQAGPGATADLHNLFQQTLRPSLPEETVSSYPQFVVDLTPSLDEQLQTLAEAEIFRLTKEPDHSRRLLVLLHPDLQKLRPGETSAWSLRFRYGQGSLTESWISHGRGVWISLSAQAAPGGLDNGEIEFLKKTRLPQVGAPGFLEQLVTVVESAVTHVFCPDLPHTPVEFSERLEIHITQLSDCGSASSPILAEAVQREVRSLLHRAVLPLPPQLSVLHLFFKSYNLASHMSGSARCFSFLLAGIYSFHRC